MVKHYIVMASAYSIGKRIVLDYFSENFLPMAHIQKDIDYILKECGFDAPISMHYIQTEELGWDKVVELDRYFEETKLIESKEEFVEILKRDRNLNGMDIAKYILTKVSCMHLKLEKLVYMCYADYLCSAGSKLFDDKIYAYKLGPVVASVYETFKKHDYLKAENIKTYDEQMKKMAIRSRILSSCDGVKKLISIDKTLEKYLGLSASELVTLTHGDGTPWSKAGKGNLLYGEISDDLILRYHRFEEK